MEVVEDIEEPPPDPFAKKRKAPETPETRVPAPGTPTLDGSASESGFSAVSGFRSTAESESTDQSKVVSMILANCKESLKHYGSPSNFLSEHLKDKNAASVFMNWLWDTFPEKQDILYSFESVLPHISSEREMGDSLPLRMHVATLGFSKACSVKPPCGSDLALELMEQYMKSGFITADAPLLVTQPDGFHCFEHSLDAPCQKGGLNTGIHAFNLGYTKGFARASTLLMLCHRLMSAHINVAEMLPQFHESVSQIYVHNIKNTSRIEEALLNMKLSSRGSLRKSNNLIQCVFMLKTLMVVGGLQDCGVFVRRWNAMTTKQFAIAGRKAMSLKQLFDITPKDPPIMCHQLVDFLTHHKSKFLNLTIKYLIFRLFIILIHFGFSRSYWTTSWIMLAKLAGTSVHGVTTTSAPKNSTQGFSSVAKALGLRG